jgi:NAD(P)-dependent dehydrogenase (short-subunit alcohol dehydrogenase family)
VSGGSAGVGKAIALRLAQAGAKTSIVARDAGRLDAARADFVAQGLEVSTYSADISDAKQCSAFIEHFLGEQGGIHVLVNNAGRSIRRAIENSYPP